jgi:hypothetical protein
LSPGPLAGSGACAPRGRRRDGIDIAGPVSSTLEVEPATPEELAETGQLVEAVRARWRSSTGKMQGLNARMHSQTGQARLDQRDLRALRAAVREARAAFGRLDITSVSGATYDVTGGDGANYTA